jgi:hypothetical protein
MHIKLITLHARCNYGSTGRPSRTPWRTPRPEIKVELRSRDTLLYTTPGCLDSLLQIDRHRLITIHCQPAQQSPHPNISRQVFQQPF